MAARRTGLLLLSPAFTWIVVFTVGPVFILAVISFWTATDYGIKPEWTLDNYTGIVRALRQAYPKVGIKAFTAVEVEWAARISKQSVESVLRQFKDAGLTALPGC